MRTLKIRPAFFYIIFLLLILSCANERAITGGPVDRQAPTIIWSTPSSAETGISRRTKIELKFSEQMNRKSLQSAVQIWPKPPGGFKLKTGWTWLKLEFPEPLEADETYLLTVDKSAKDLQGNALSATYVLAFSTGDRLNRGQIRGRIYGAGELARNGDLLLYKDYQKPLDTLRNQQADFVFQPDDDGGFHLPYLAERPFMLFYHWDRNHNKKIDGDDYFGRPHSITVIPDDSVNQFIAIRPQIRPMASIKLLESTALTDTYIKCRVDRPVSETGMNDLELYADNRLIPLKGWTLDIQDEYAFYLHTDTSISSAEKMWVEGFIDTSGYSLNSDTLELKMAMSPDSLELAIVSRSFTGRKEKLFPPDKGNYELRFSLPVQFRPDSVFRINKMRDSLAVSGVVTQPSSTVLHFAPDSVLTYGESFQWTLETRFITPLFPIRKPDSLLSGPILSVSPDSLGSLTLTQNHAEMLNCEIHGKGVERTILVPQGEVVTVDHLPAGIYTLLAYVDTNRNRRYDSGGLATDAVAEPFWVYPQSLRIRARWELDIGAWELGNDASE